MIDGTITGSWNNYLIRYRFYPGKDLTKDTYVFFHGAYGTSLDNPRDNMLIHHLIEMNLGNIFCYETSRPSAAHNQKLNWEEKINLFEGKTFQNELDDVQLVFSHLHNTLVRNSDKSKYHFIGFSLGGTLASFLLPQYGGLVDSICLFGSGISTNGVDKPITSTYADQSIILSNYQSYSGSLTLVQGSEDTVVPMDPAKLVLEVALKARWKQLVVMYGVDHTFKYLHGHEAIEKIAPKIFSLIDFSV
jgi:pimeloyl-ACP methyl ester carboxylesterase